jgi:hypothetical protein
VSVTAGSVSQIDIGGQPFDQGVIAGRAIHEGDYALPGTPVTALINGVECGATTVSGDALGTSSFQLTILGADERLGCAVESQPVSFRVGGVGAQQQWSYIPQKEQVFPGRFGQSLAAMNEHAWFWVQQGADELPPAGTVIRATVGGILCGETMLDTSLGASGFSRLAVPSANIQAGCGAPGRRVEFSANGAAFATTVFWQPGVQRITLTPDSVLPSTKPNDEEPTGVARALPRSGASHGSTSGAGYFWVASWLMGAILLALELIRRLLDESKIDKRGNQCECGVAAVGRRVEAGVRPEGATTQGRH